MRSLETLLGDSKMVWTDGRTALGTGIVAYGKCRMRLRNKSNDGAHKIPVFIAGSEAPMIATFRKFSLSSNFPAIGCLDSVVAVSTKGCI